MLRVVCLLVIVVIALAAKPEVGSPHCVSVLATNCSTYSPEPVCAFDGHTHVTYQNSCEFAKGLCTHHGHSLHAVHEGPCNPATDTP